MKNIRIQYSILLACSALIFSIWSCEKSDKSENLYNYTKIVSYCDNTPDAFIGASRDVPNPESGCAILLKSDLVNSRSIKGVRVYLDPSWNMNPDVKFQAFITASLKKDPLYIQEFSLKQTGWEYIEFDKAFYTEGYSSLYVGIKYNSTDQLCGISGTKYQNNDADFILSNGQIWHLPDIGIIATVNVQPIIEYSSSSAPSDRSDLDISMVKSPESSIKIGENFKLKAAISNLGNKTVSGYNVSMTFDGNVVYTEDVSSSLSIGAVESLEIDIPTETNGETSYIVNVTPLSDSDANIRNNSINGTTIISNKVFDRIMLIEYFTSQACPNCPGGISNMNSVLGRLDEGKFVKIGHHVGYAEDSFTIPESRDLTKFYGSPSTYAPAMMIDRSDVKQEGEIVFNPYLLTYDIISKQAEYPSIVRIDLDLEYNESSREIVISVNGESGADLKNARLNIYLAQNNLIAEQSEGGDNFSHQAVIRDMLSGEDGDPVNFSDYKFSKTYTYTLPETITGYDCVPEDMYIVAFLTEYDENTLTRNKVYNTAVKFVKE